MMRAILTIGCAALALGLSACGDADNDAAEANLAAENVVIDQNAAMTDMNAMNADEHQNMMMNDITNNDADTNLANGY